MKDDAAIRPGAGEFLAGENDAAAGDVVQAGDHREHGGFAAAGVADERDEFALAILQIEVLTMTAGPCGVG